MRPGPYGVKIIRGTTFHTAFTWKDANLNPYDLTGYSAVAHFNGVDDAGPFNADVILGGVSGIIDVQITADNTALIEWEDGEWYLNLTNPAGEIFRLLEGPATVRD